jgi:DNA polymerase-3 subunit delta'
MPSFKHDLLVHQRTQAQIENFLAQPAHALLLTGATGSGKYTLAKAIAANLLKLDDPHRFEAYPYYWELKAPDGKQEISIDAVREMIEKLRLKAPGRAALRRIVVIEGAQNLSQEAQNALLKTLEEPNPDSAFILTSPSARAIAPTIVSRAQGIIVYPITLSSALTYYKQMHNKDNVASNWLLSAGAAGLLDSLLKDDVNHPLKDGVNNFKKFLSSDTYERLLYCDSLSRDKSSIIYFLDGGKRVLRALQQNSIRKQQSGRTRTINDSRKLINSLQTKLEANTNLRLVALSLTLNLKL